MESHRAGLPPFPHSLEIPSRFPHSHGLDDWIYVFSSPLNSNHRHRKGLVTDVSGPQRNECSGTLTPLRRFCCCRCISGNQGRRCGQERGCYETIAQTRLIAVPTSESSANFSGTRAQGLLDERIGLLTGLYEKVIIVKADVAAVLVVSNEASGVVMNTVKGVRQDVHLDL
jgi:hypothetical protein